MVTLSSLKCANSFCCYSVNPKGIPLVSKGFGKEVISSNTVMSGKGLRTGGTTALESRMSQKAQVWLYPVGAIFFFLENRQQCPCWPCWCCFHDPWHNEQVNIESHGLRACESLHFQETQHVISNCHFNDVAWSQETIFFFFIRKPWATYSHHGRSRDSRRHERRLLMYLWYRSLLGIISMFQFGQISETSVTWSPNIEEPTCEYKLALGKFVIWCLQNPKMVAFFF